MSLPVASPTRPFWHTVSHSLSSHRSTSELPPTQDVLIIGAGFAGAACAYYLTQVPDPVHSITIIEARDACSGASGRNGGHVRPESLATFAKFADRPDMANEIAKFEIENAAAVAQLVQELGIDCDFEEVTSSNVYLDQSLADAAKDLRNKLAGMGYDVADRFTYHDEDTAADVTGVPGANGAMTFPAACLWPYKFVMHLLSLAVSKGANLQTNTPVLSISQVQDPDGYWTVTTERGPTRAKNIIFATNGYTRHLLPCYAGKIIPTRGICSHIKADAAASMPKLAPAVRTMGIKYSPGCQDYLISRGDGSIVIGGAWKVVRPGPCEDWSDVLDDSKLVPAAETYYDGFMERTFASWKTVPSQVDHLWTGIMGYTSDGVPHVGKVDCGPGLFICAGFNGHGMPQVLLCAKAVAKMLLEGCDFGETGVPSSFRTGRP